MVSKIQEIYFPERKNTQFEIHKTKASLKPTNEVGKYIIEHIGRKQYCSQNSVHKGSVLKNCIFNNCISEE